MPKVTNRADSLANDIKKTIRKDDTADKHTTIQYLDSSTSAKVEKHQSQPIIPMLQPFGILHKLILVIWAAGR